MENDIKLMRMPGWLVNEDRRKRIRLKSVSAVIDLERESIMVKLVEEDLEQNARKIGLKRYVEEKQLVFGMNCVMVGHS